MIAHDLRNTLLVIVAQAESIEAYDAAKSEKQIAKATGKVLSNANRMANMISATLERARADITTLTLDTSLTDLTGLVRTAMEAWSESKVQAKTNGRHLRLAFLLEMALPDGTLKCLTGFSTFFSHPLSQEWPVSQVVCTICGL